MDKVNEDSAPVQITRNGKKAAVLLSLDDWSSIQETLYVLQNKSLMRQINTAEAGRHQGYKPNKNELNEILGI